MISYSDIEFLHMAYGFVISITRFLLYITIYGFLESSLIYLFICNSYSKAPHTAVIGANISSKSEF